VNASLSSSESDSESLISLESKGSPPLLISSMMAKDFLTYLFKTLVDLLPGAVDGFWIWR
jgi:hypothetical protein